MGQHVRHRLLREKRRVAHAERVEDALPNLLRERLAGHPLNQHAEHDIVEAEHVVDETAGDHRPHGAAHHRQCHACHAANRAPDLLPGRSWNATFEVPAIQNPDKFFVAPFNADASYLLDKILGIQSSGARMPLGATPLSAEQTDLIRSWILEGAANN